MLPFSQAIKLPFDFYHKIKFNDLSGKVVLNTSNLRRGMFKLGAQGSDMFSSNSFVLDLKGTLKLNGHISVGIGCTIRVEEKGVLELEDNVVIGARSLVLCEESVLIKNNTITSWDCQIMDTDTHSIIDVKSNEVFSRSKPIVIGESCWLGNKVLVNKGTLLPNNTIVASFSLCNRDYTQFINQFSILAGVPAKLVSSDKRMFGDKLGV
tara:strand:+ start:274 stop:900 length:627 start_codon:yes stop_codon:yes gene_type:complete